MGIEEGRRRRREQGPPGGRSSAASNLYGHRLKRGKKKGKNTLGKTKNESRRGEKVTSFHWKKSVPVGPSEKGSKREGKKECTI